jgi:hypothetical protein
LLDLLAVAGPVVRPHSHQRKPIFGSKFRSSESSGVKVGYFFFVAAAAHVSPRRVLNTSIVFLFQLFVWPVRGREIWFRVHWVGHKTK